MLENHKVWFAKLGFKCHFTEVRNETWGKRRGEGPPLVFAKAPTKPQFKPNLSEAVWNTQGFNAQRIIINMIVRTIWLQARAEAEDPVRRHCYRHIRPRRGYGDPLPADTSAP